VDVGHIADISEVYAAIISMVRKMEAGSMYLQNMGNTAYIHMVQRKTSRAESISTWGS
jgi:hypothetical protein